MKLKFSIDYRTFWGQKVYICGSLPELGSWDELKAVALQPTGGEKWEIEINLPKRKVKSLEYKYLIRNDSSNFDEWEHGDKRKVVFDNTVSNNWMFRDFWRPNRAEANNLYLAPFKNAFFSRKPSKLNVGKEISTTGSILTFQLRATRISEDYSICVIGNHLAIGDWDEKKALVLSDTDFPMWTGSIDVKDLINPIIFKFGIYDVKKKIIVSWEAGDNRNFILEESTKNTTRFVISCEDFKYPVGNWKAAGVAIPVFSIRTNNSCGVGEFSDIKLLVDWAKIVGMKVVQVLPVNDTVASKTWVDSYPYAAVSVYALHPIYGNITAIGPLKNKVNQKHADTESNRLNELDHVAYEDVMAIKSQYYKWSFDEQQAEFLKSKSFLEFFNQNQHWLVPYAAFSYLRDKNGTVEFAQWGTNSTTDDKKLKKLTDPESKIYADIAIHYFIQYHLDKQLKEATDYGRKTGVVLKGDIPIGIYKNSVDAWLYPSLFHMDCQAGAPPDDFSVSGQNWGFPTYNWEEMAKDGYLWWKQRLQKMADYFDVFRIDHILGFFRIWEIPNESVEGTMGHFNPSLPLSAQELFDNGIPFDMLRMCRPYIRTHVLNSIFKNHASDLAAFYLQESEPGVYYFKESFNTQKKIKNYFEGLISRDSDNKVFHELIRAGLYQLHGEVLFFEASMTNGTAFDPRVGLHNTFSFRDLDGRTKEAINRVYIDYFYKRHNDFWRSKAMEKLPALKSATEMLICGEDLGMVPDCVPGVMDELSILSLAVQRMPNDATKEFWHPGDTNYLSVCTTSSHDTSTLRGWWEEDRSKTQRFFNNLLGNWGEAPQFCDPWVATQVVNQHLYSPSMLAIFPLQDLLAMNDKLRRIDPSEERINVPAISQHYWKYRMHLTVESLIEEAEFNQFLNQLNTQSGRNTEY
jgi:4-alpha-glucanotransferase